MKKMIKSKKLLSVLCMLCIFSISVSSFAAYAADISFNVNASESNPFKDISGDKWYSADVLKANELGIMKGVSDNLFAPELPMTREMFVTALYRMAQIGDVAENAFLIKFDDVNFFKGIKWYYYPVAWATDMGVTQGIDENNFGVGQLVTREQIATFIYRYLNNGFISISIPQVENPTPAFADTPSDYAKEAVEFMRLTGIINGVGDNKFAPKAEATRAEAATMLCRLYDIVKDAEYSFNFEAGRYKEIRISTYANGQSKTKSVTDKAEIARALEYINSIEIISSHEDNSGNPYEYSFVLYDNSRNDFIFSFGITNTGGARHKNLVFETDKFKPFIEYINS